MPGPLTAAGAVTEPSEYATLSMDRHITGLWTQRSPLRDADVPYLYGKFYSASRFDSLIDGINREVTARLTTARRPGSSPYNTNTFPAANSMYSFKYIQNNSEVVRVIYDGKDGVIYDATAGQKTALFTKSAGAGKARFLGVETELFFTDGVDLKKLIRSALIWAAGTAFTVGQFIVDTNLNLQQVTTAGTTGGTQPTWATSLGATTIDGSVTWTCKGSSIQNWTPAAPTTAPIVANAVIIPNYATWAATTFYLLDNFLLDSNGNLQYLYTSGTTGTTVPAWSSTPGALTTDNTCKWLCLGTATRAINHNYFGPIQTTLVNPVTGTGSQVATPLSLANIYVGKVLRIDTGASMEPVVVTAVNVGAGTFTAVFASTHAAGVAVAGSGDTIAVDYSYKIRTMSGFIFIYFTDFFQCTSNGTSSATSTSSVPWVSGTGITTADGTVVWTNIGQQLVWNSAIVNPDGSVTQITLNPGGTNVKVSNALQIQDSHGNLQDVSFSGLSGATVPTWATVLGANTVDGGVIWTNSGSAPSSANTAPWIYAYAYENDVTLDVSTASPASQPITLNGSSVIIVQGMGSADPQVGTIPIYRTAQGQPTLLFLGSVPNPGGGNTWEFTDPGTPDTQLIPQIPAPVNNSNDPPPPNMTGPAYHVGRIWGIDGAAVVYSGGPDTLTGSGNTAWPPLNRIPLPEQGIRLFPTVTNQGPTILILGTTNVYAIFGTGTSSNPFTPATLYMAGVGILSYDAVDLVGSTYYLFTGKKKVVSLDPGAGYVEVGFPIGDQFENVTTGAGVGVPTGALYSSASTYLTWNEQDSGDTAVYVSDGAVGWFRFSPVSSPETGFLWSPRAAIVGGTSAVQSIEVSPGVTNLLIAPASSGPILFRDKTVNSDLSAGTAQAYPSYDTKGNIVLCQSGEVAEIAHIGLKSAAVGARPIVSLLLGEISPTEQTPFEPLAITSNDPPDLDPSATMYSDRYTALQNGVCPKCDNFQLKIDYGTQIAADELLMFSVYGAKHAERKQQ